MAIQPHEALKYVRPDEVAECWNGVFGFGLLYEALWECVGHYDNAHRENIEDMGPHDVIGINAVAEFWDRFAPENQAKLNELAEAQEKEWNL
jgi:hypothetical protein